MRHDVHPSASLHESVVLDPPVRVGQDARIWHFCHLCAGASVGAHTSLGQNCYVGPGVEIGARVKIQNNVSVYEGVIIEDDVFCGPSMVFTNVLHPRAARRGEFLPTRARRGASIGANATILPGVTLGAHCMVGAGAVVDGDVPDFALVVGVPARSIGWVSRAGQRLEFDSAGNAECPETGERYRLSGGQVALAER